MDSKLFALMGPYASGKSTLINKLIDMGITYIPTYTTRNPTKYDQGSNTHVFVSRSAFLQKEWIVKVTYKSEYYGILKQDMLNALKSHKVSVCIIDANGLKQIQKILHNALESIFIMVDYVTLVDRMLLLGHSNADMKYHIEYAEANGEFENWKVCNHVIKNTGSINNAFSQLTAIMGLSVVAPKTIISKL